MTQLTANDFREPLLRVLGALSGYQAGVVVPMVDTYDPIMKDMGIASLDAHGENEASGQPQVVKWIQWAHKGARKVGLTDAPPKTRGKWILTDEGVAEARKLAGLNGTTPAAPTPTTPTGTPVTPINLNLPTGLLLVSATAYQGYHPDAYVRKLAIDGTGCFGHISQHGKAVCTNCPLRVECRDSQIAGFANLANLLAAEDHAANQPKPAPKATKAQQVQKPKSKSKSKDNRFDKIDFSNGDIILNKAEALCVACGETIEKDERCRWIEELPDDDDGGLFHLGCSGGEGD